MRYKRTEHKVENGIELKYCHKCQQWKQLSEFNNATSKWDRLTSRCRVCSKQHYIDTHKVHNARARAYYQANKAEINKQSMANYITNRDEHIAKKKQYRKDNYDVQIEREREYNRTHKHIRKAWNTANLDKFREYNRKRRAKKRDLNESYTKFDEFFTRTLFMNRCYRCGTTDNLSIDHHIALANNGVLSPTTAVVLCKSCNSSKGTKAPKDFYNAEQFEDLKEIFEIVEVQGVY